ncbi:MAG: site-2 protease family protein, partial [Acetatifactor sp.]|nr:site-2 protease family protein [Acetatifactor sp.]
MRIETIILFIIIFGIVVISHELGHFLLAKAGGIHVVEFSIGMGPTLLSFQKGNTKYSLKLLPIGGACMFEGEDGLNLEEDESSTGAFPNANVWKRI